MSRTGRNAYQGADYHTREAHKAGFVARSVFKLSEIDRRVDLLSPGQHVLDLGAAPGSWSAYAAQKIGNQGRLLAVDLKPLTARLDPWCTVIEGDAFALESCVLDDLAPYDVVLSDMAPNTTGHKGVDQARSFDLFCRALELATALLRPEGSFVGKLFMSGEYEEARNRMRQSFAKVRTIRPETTRSVSSEIFLVGLTHNPI